MHWKAPTWLLLLDLFAAELAFSAEDRFLAVLVAPILFAVAAALRCSGLSMSATVAQSTHMVWGAAIFGLRFTALSHMFASTYVQYAVLVGVLVLKEGVFDTYVEGQTLRESGYMDFSYYVVGYVVAALMLALSIHCF